MIDIIVGEGLKLRKWRLLFGLMAALSVAVIVLLWRNHVSLDVMRDTLKNFADVVAEIRSDGAPTETVQAYETEYASMQVSLEQSIGATTILGSARVVFGLMTSGPGALVGLIIGAASVGIELSSGFMRTQLLAGVSRQRFVVLKVVAWLQMAALSLATAIVLGALATVFFDWLYHRPIAFGTLSIGVFLTGAIGALAVVLVWASIAGLATYLTRSTIGGVVIGGGYLLLDAVVSQNVQPFTNKLLTSNIWRITGVVGGSPPGSESMAFNRVWFENYTFYTLSTVEASLVIGAFIAGAFALMYVAVRGDDVVL